ncbi:MAG: CoA transferase [Desulfobacterales bacterium]|nr:CoA transferase [Desulfobacterales bacterium]
MLLKGALSGITVLDMSRLLPGPYCSMILADHGARVIAIEDRRFEAESALTRIVNRNKEHMSLNLKTDAGKTIFYELVKKADVIIEGFRPGVVDRLSVNYEHIKAINEKIIYCSITGYGQTGAYRDRVGHDVNYLSVSGVLNLIGQHNQPPSIPGVQLADIAGGAMNATIGILLALFAREKTGIGQYIDISMTDGMVGLLPLPLSFLQFTGKEPERSEGLLSHRYACYNVYETADGRYLSLGAVEYRFWQKICEVFGVKEYIPFQYDDSRRHTIIEYFRNKIKEKTLSEWEHELNAQEICWAPVRTLSEVLQDSLFQERQMIVRTSDNSSPFSLTIGVPIKLSTTPGSVRTLPPEFGHNTELILKELGYSISDIQEFQSAGVV